MSVKFKDLTNEQYCRMNALCNELRLIAPTSIMCDVVARRDNILNKKASYRGFVGFLKKEIKRLEAA